MLYRSSPFVQYAGLCPQVFTEATMRENFPNTDLAAWDIIESFGPTPSGAQGFTVQIPEMDKVRIRAFTYMYTLRLHL